MRLIEVAKEYGTQESCNDLLESMRWPEGVACVECHGNRVSKYIKNESTRQRKNPKSGMMETKIVPARILYVCLDCKKQFSVTHGTIFADTHLPLEKWFMAIALMVNAKKGLSAMQMQRDIGCTYKTAWYLCHRIRKAMEGSAPDLFTGIVEADATFVGGKFDKRRKRAKYGKQPVFGIVQRNVNGVGSKVYAAPVLAEIKRETNPIIEAYVDRNATMHTDDNKAYAQLGKRRTHHIVIHSAGQYVNGDCHSNSVEGFWSLFKRQLIGQHHQISVKHLNRYLQETSFKFNNKEHEDVFSLVILNLLIGSALRYAALVGCEDVPLNAPDWGFDKAKDEDDLPF